MPVKIELLPQYNQRQALHYINSILALCLLRLEITVRFKDNALNQCREGIAAEQRENISARMTWQRHFKAFLNLQN